MIALAFCEARLQYTEEDLERMYALFSRVPATLKDVQKVMIDCICEAGKEILNDPEKVKDPVCFISAILRLKYKFDQFVKNATLVAEAMGRQKLELVVDDGFHNDEDLGGKRFNQPAWRSDHFAPRL